VSGGTRSYEWFSDWVEQHLGLTVTVAPGPNPVALLTAFGLHDCDRGECTLDEADDADQEGVAVVRIGVADERACAVEHFTTRGSDPAVLGPLSAGGDLAVAVSFTQTINVLMVARQGVLTSGLDIDVPICRFGVAPYALDAELREVGVLGGPAGNRAAACARFIELTTGVVLTPELIEGRLPCATLP
jgi:hypothetical protein